MSKHEGINARTKAVIKDLKPKIFWDYFYQMSRIPRESKNEAAISDWLYKVGKDLGVEVLKDKALNILYRVPASKGFEKVPMVTLQSHMDMVCEKLEEKDHDFDKDPIELKQESEDWICADGTTLGADNGSGLCIMLALTKQRNDYEHGPFECLFTTDEETGMTGVEHMAFEWFQGKYLINLDSEDWGEIFVGCAGGADAVIHAPVEEEECKCGGKAYLFKLGGLLGGHSGCDINYERCNGNKFLNKFLYKMMEEKLEFCLCDYLVDSKFNAIPRAGTMVLRFNPEILPAVEKLMDKVVKETVDIYGTVGDKDVKFTVKEVDASKYKMCWKKDFLVRFNKVMRAIPHGIHRVSHDLEGGIVETSNNLSNMYIKDGRIEIGACSRSMNTDALKDLIDSIACVAELAGFTCRREKPYPGWTPVPGSKVMKIAEEVFMKKFPDEGKPRVLAIHAGLECGFLQAKSPTIECVSIGPNIRNAHTPREKMQISTNLKFWDYIIAIMEEFTKREW